MSRGGKDTKQVLFSATLDLIAEKGFSGTTVDEIVERAGVAKGTVYYHFKSKAELVRALIEQHLAPLAEQFQAAIETASGDPVGQIEALVQAELQFIFDDRQFAKLLVTEMWREDRLWRDSLSLLRHDALGVVRSVIDAGIEAGRFSADIDSKLASSALFGMIATVALDWLMSQPDRPMEDIVRQVRPLAVRSLLAD